MKIVVTGGAGFIGSTVTDVYVSRGHDVIVVDNLATGKRENLNPKARFVELDIRDPKTGDLIRREKPRLIITSYPEDRHPDHARAGRLVTDAAFYAGLRKIETRHPAHRPQQTIYFSTNYVQEPDFVVDVTETMEIRRAAMRAFASQFYREGSTEPETMLSKNSFLDAMEGRARHFGFLIGVEFAEGFSSKRPPRIDDVVAAFEGFEAGF